MEGLQFRVVAAEFRFQRPDFLPVLDAFDEAFETDRRAAFGIDEVGVAGGPFPEPRVADRILDPRVVGPAQESVVILGGGVPAQIGRLGRRRRGVGVRESRRTADVEGGRQPLAAALDDVRLLDRAEDAGAHVLDVGILFEDLVVVGQCDA